MIKSIKDKLALSLSTLTAASNIAASRLKPEEMAALKEPTLIVREAQLHKTEEKKTEVEVVS